METLFIDANLDTLSDGSILDLAHQAGVLVEEERQFPDLVRVRLRRNTYEK